MKFRSLGCATLAICALSHQPRAAEDDKRPAAGIQDNSFLIEEAYNQGPNEVQHINALRRQGKDWFYTFTQEWPLFSQAHQVSYTVPYAKLKSDMGFVSGFGDLQLNYRYQLFKESDSRPAIAPRFTWIIPTGNDEKGLGVGAHGFQFNLPVSKIVTDHVSLHGNAGFTRYNNIQGLGTTSYAVAGSAIYAVSRDFNVMLEGVREWNEAVEGGVLERERAWTVSPGFRKALNLEGDTQVVFGVAAPVRFVDNSGKRDYGVFLYLSIEHPIRPSLK